MTVDSAYGADVASVKAFPPQQPERGVWHTITRIEKYHDGVIEGDPDEVVEVEGNVLCDPGIDVMLGRLAKNVGLVYSGANAYVAAGDNNAVADHTDTTLTNEYAAGRFNATAVVTNQFVAFSANFAAGDATGAWEEVGVFNAVGKDNGDMLNHVVASLGNKAGAAAWILTITITIS